MCRCTPRAELSRSGGLRAQAVAVSAGDVDRGTGQREPSGSRAGIARVPHRSVAVAVVAGLVLLTVVAQGEAQSSRAMSPAEWEQWQPQAGDRDPRLDTRLTVWDPDIGLADLVSRISASTGVRLLVADGLRRVRLTAYARDCRLHDLMSTLASLIDGYWCYPRGQTLAEREYGLTTPNLPLDSPADVVHALAAAERRLCRAEADAYRTAWASRLEQYETAFALSQERLLAKYEETDPWLCATLLDPRLRPMIAQVLHLPAEKRARLLEYGFIMLPALQLSPEFRNHLGRWVNEEWGPPRGGGMGVGGPDAATAYTEPEQRWRNARLALTWADDRLNLTLKVGDLARYSQYGEEIIVGGDEPPLQARRRLIRLGLREQTPEYMQRIEEEMEAWQAEHPGAGRAPEQRSGPAEPVTTDPRVKELVRLPAGKRVALTDALECIANQLDLGVLANRPWPAQAHQASALPGVQSELPLGDVLQDARSTLGPNWAWRFRGRYLLVYNVDYLLARAAMIPDELLADWEELLQPDSTIPLENLARLAARTSRVQLTTLRASLPNLLRDLRVPLARLAIYGRLTEEQRQMLSRAEGLPVSQLRPDTTAELWYIARRSRRWLEECDLENAVLRAHRQRLSTGEQGISLVCDYHLDWAPDDRDVLFTAPLRVHLQAAGQGESAGMPERPE